MHKNAERDSYLRCDKCHTCQVCKEWKGNDRFDKKSSICMKSAQRQIMHKCNACNIEKQISLFNPNILEHAICHNRQAVCIMCQQKGFSPKDTQPHLCEGCGEKGHLKFSSQALKDAKKPGRSNLLLCVDCTSRRKEIEQLMKKKMHGNAHVKEIIIVAPCNASCTPRKPANEGGQEKTKALQRTT